MDFIISPCRAHKIHEQNIFTYTDITEFITPLTNEMKKNVRTWSLMKKKLGSTTVMSQVIKIIL